MTVKSNNTKSTKNNGWLYGGIAAIVVVILLIVTQQPVSPASTMPAEVSVPEAAALQSQGALILDVRERTEWEAGHIEGAILIPLGQLSDRVSELPTDQTIVVVCHTGNRSAQGRDILRKAGFIQTTSMAGGMNDWIARGNPVVTGP